MQTREADLMFKSLIFIRIQKGRQENGCGQAKGQNQFRVEEVQSGRQACGQDMQNVQAGGYRVQKQGSKPGGQEKGEKQKAGDRGNRWLTWKHTGRTGTERQETQG